MKNIEVALDFLIDKKIIDDWESEDNGEEFRWVCFTIRINENTLLFLTFDKHTYELIGIDVKHSLDIEEEVYSN